MSLIPPATTLVNFLALGVSLWLGLYIVTRSPRSPVSWLAALTLWSLSSVLLNTLIHLNVAPGEQLPYWLEVFRGTAIPAIAFWLHLTVLLLPEPATRRQRSVVVGAYVLAVIIFGLEVFTDEFLPGETARPRIYASSRQAGSLYPIYVGYLLLTSVAALANLTSSWRQAQRRAIRRQFRTLLAATALAAMGGMYLSVSIWLSLDVPTVLGDAGLGLAVLLLGYTVAKYNALVEGRVLELDFFYTFLSVAGATTFVVSLVLALYFHYRLPFIVIILVAEAVIVTYALYDWARTTLDRIFYQHPVQSLRANLRALAREAGTGPDLRRQLRSVLATICHSLAAKKGVIAVRENGEFVVATAYHAGPVGRLLTERTLISEEIGFVPTTPEDEGLIGMVLLVPLQRAGQQVGALLLGEKAGGASYSDDDLDLLDDLADQVAAIIHESHAQQESARQLSTLVTTFRQRERELQLRVQELIAQQDAEAMPILEGVDDKAFVAMVEDGLRHLHDFAYLGEHVLAKLEVVSLSLENGRESFVTHLDRGRVLHRVLLRALNKLCPEGPEPKHLTREWHPFTILHDAYVLGKLNRDTMSKLYISEGTFNRTRRRAIRGVARAVMEMERDAERAGVV